MAPTLKEKRDLDALKLTLATLTALLSQLSLAVKTPHAPLAPQKNINALTLSHDAAQLIKAHSTKLSLLIINAPFTPTAITTVLRELASGPLPALASAIEVCDAGRYTMLLRSELVWRVQKVLNELRELLNLVPLDGKVLSEQQKNGPTGEGNGSLATTGLVWAACEGLMDLKRQGIAGVVVRKAEQWRETLRDAIGELHEWGEEESDDEEDDDEDAGSGEEGEKDAQEEMDELFAERHITKADPEGIRPRLVQSERKLKMVALLYNAAIKRRFQTLSAMSLPVPQTAVASEPAPGVIETVAAATTNPAERIDAILDALRQIPDAADELANAFYELDSEGIDEAMTACFAAGVKASELLARDWEGKEDEFTEWTRKFKLEMEK